MLYIFIFLHQTTTTDFDNNTTMELYIFIFLHQTTTELKPQYQNALLYIFIFLHQTTTNGVVRLMMISCISLYSYIKPQRCCCASWWWFVVYLYIPTSNHNYKAWFDTYAPLYIFIFLHQTTTESISKSAPLRCISLYSYIKPQPKETNILIIR